MRAGQAGEPGGGQGVGRAPGHDDTSGGTPHTVTYLVSQGTCSVKDRSTAFLPPVLETSCGATVLAHPTGNKGQGRCLHMVCLLLASKAPALAFVRKHSGGDELEDESDLQRDQPSVGCCAGPARPGWRAPCRLDTCRGPWPSGVLLREDGEARVVAWAGCLTLVSKFVRFSSLCVC